MIISSYILCLYCLERPACGWDTSAYYYLICMGAAEPLTWKMSCVVCMCVGVSVSDRIWLWHVAGEEGHMQCRLPW